MSLSFTKNKKPTSVNLQLYFKIFALNVNLKQIFNFLFYFYALFQHQLIQMLNDIISKWDV